MSRWNPCCCAGPVVLPEDMVLVRAGWYHFMVMTKDGKIQVFIGSGVRINQYDQPFWSIGVFSKGLVGPDGINYRDAPLWYIDELGIHVLADKNNLDCDAWKLINDGTHGNTLADPWYQGILARDYLEGPPYYGQNDIIFGMHTLYPEACLGWGGATGQTGGISGPLLGITAGDGYYRPELGYPTTPNNAVSVGGCPHYKIIGNIAVDYYLNPGFPINFDGTGISIGRPPGSTGHARLVEARGLSLIAGISLQTIYESYDLIAKPAPSDHPLAIPTELKNRLDSGERRVIDIECGAYHNIVRLDDNSIVCWGLNAYGQCNVPDILRPSWEIPNGEIISASIDLAGLTTSERLVTIENPELQIYEIGYPLTGVGGRARLLTDPAALPDGPRIFEVVGIELLASGKGYKSEFIHWKLPGNELNGSILARGITFDVAAITSLSNIKDTVCSLHAGFNTTAVLFNGGTAFCWGDPEVADQVNTWKHIRISPIKKSSYNEANCNGTNTEGYVDPEFPEFPENKYKKNTYNANTDWFGYWRTGTPAYPHFDLGVETNKIYPLEWGTMPADTTNPSKLSVPYGICDQCNGYWNNDGQDKIKDFAVGMLRTGQIVTTRKINARDASADLCRDCSYDSKYTVSDGKVGWDWKGVNVANYSAAESPNEDDQQFIDCIQLAASFGLVEICSRPTDSIVCDEYKKWYIPADEIQCNEDLPQPLSYPEGIGCYSSLGNREVVLYDHNWAYITEKSGQFYAPAKQVRPLSHPLGPNPYYNTKNINTSYGWETLVVSYGRTHENSQSLYNLIGTIDCRSSTTFTPSKCVTDLGQSPCTIRCPSSFGFVGNFKRNGNIDQYGVPGIFRYPAQIANTLMCSAGTNTVNWMYYPKLLNPEGYEGGIYSGGDGSERGAQLKASNIVEENCPKYHTGKGKNSCSECDNYTNNPLLHIDEVADTSTACIYANEYTNPSEDGLNDTNPLKQGVAGLDPCGARAIGQDFTYMLPSRPWGPWQLFTHSGTASPRETELSLCSWGVLKYDFCAYMNITQKAETYGGIISIAWDGTFGLGEGLPSWFKLYSGGPNSSDSACQLESNGTDTVRRPIRREGGIRPVSSAWKSYFENPINIPACYYPAECFDFDSKGNKIIPPGGNPISGRCPLGPTDPTDPNAPLSLVDCTLGEYGPCGGGILGGQIPNLAKYCYPDTFKSLPTCIDNTANVCGTVGCDQGIGNSCNKWFLNNPALSYATGRMFSVFVRRSPWYRAQVGTVNFIAGGGEHSMLLNTNGEFTGWGRNVEGQVTATSTLFNTIEGGLNHNIAITKNSQQILCFGDNTYGQCDVPSGLAGATAVSAGWYHSMALKKNNATNKNEVFCWGCVKELLQVDGYQYTGETPPQTSVQIVACDDPMGGDFMVTGISGGDQLYYNGFTASTPKSGKYDMHFRIKNLGGITATVAVEDYDKYVNNNSSRVATIQIPLTGVTLLYGVTQNWITVKAKDIELTRGEHSFVLRDITTTLPGGITGWNLNWFKVFPQEQNNKGQCDVPPTGLTSPSMISAGKYHSVAIVDTGGSDVVSNVICWGDNSVQQCTVPEGLTGIVDIKAGEYHTIALNDRGEVKCWGGIVCPEGLTGVIAISSGARHGIAIKQTVSPGGTYKEIITFGDDVPYGLDQIPSGLTADPSGLTGIEIDKISCGNYHNIVLRSDGTIKIWGNNNYGQLNIPDNAYNSGLLGGEFIWEATCPTTYEQSFPDINFSQTGWKGEFVGTKGTKIWTAGILLDPCPPWPILDGITAYYPSWVPRASGAGNNIAKKGIWLDGTWTPTGATGLSSYEKYINIDGFTLARAVGDPVTNYLLDGGPVQPKIKGYIIPPP